MNNQKEQLLKTKNTKLKEGLAEKNHELKIEAGLELVRMVAMKMHSRNDMTKVCKSISHQLEKLGVKEIRNVQTAIFNEDRHSYMNYEYYAKHDKTFITEVDFTHHAVKSAFANQMLKGKGYFFSTSLEGKKLKEFIEHQKEGPEFVDSFLFTSPSLTWYWYSLGSVALGISTYAPLNENEVELFKRFRNVFELAYTRYLDIEKAESQAREAQIELALERVRSRAMAMHSSAELKEVVQTLFETLRHLDVNLQACLITTFDTATFDQRSWIIHSKSNEPYSFLILNNQQPFYQEMLKAWKERNASWSYMLEGETKTKWENFLFTDTEFRLLPKEVKEEMHKPKKVFFAASYYKYGAIQASSSELFSNTSTDLLQRFSKVFDSCYTRFLDLQKAEAQAREAQIEVGLERVRSRAMAMQSSEELKVLIGTIFAELTRLDLALTRCTIWIFDPANNGARWWMANSEDPANPVSFFIQSHKHHVYLAFVNAWEKQTQKFIYDLKGKEKISWDKFLFNKTELKQLPEIVKSSMREPERVVLSSSFYNFGGINTASLEPLSDEHFDILLRFAKVFDLTYTRFLDLKNAEAQAREAKIQLALERVRAKAMAMHTSEELSSTVNTFFKELKILGIIPLRCGVGEMHEEEKASDITLTTARQQGDAYRVLGKVKHIGHPIMEGVFKNWKAQREYYPVLRGKELKDYYKVLSANLNIDLNIKSENGRVEYGYWIMFSEGMIFAWTEKKLSDEDLTIFRRFTSVLSLTYKRYNDLKQAEAQAREAKIQLALERVRARTMAMQKSSELGDVAALLFQQVKSLGIDSYSSGFTIWENDDRELVSWMSNADGSINPPFKMPVTEIDWHKQQYESWKKKEGFLIHDFTGQEMQEHYKYLRSFPLLDEAFKKSESAGVVTPPRQVHNAFNFSQGNLLFITLQPVPESHEIFKRFAKVFEQTYTRFLDLEKAEAQAREAQIELALERVRAKSLAMHHSFELQEVVDIVAHQLHNMNIDMNGGVFICINKEVGNDVPLWAAAGAADYVRKVIVPNSAIPTISGLRDAIRKGNNFLEEEFSNKEKKEFFRLLFKYEPWKSLAEERKKELLAREGGYARSVVVRQHTSIAMINHNGKRFSDNENGILKRFGNVFEQSYTRFLDLKNAEAQAREAQIQLALERVRARTMAMYRSPDLLDVIKVLGDQFQLLGFKIHSANFNTSYREKDWNLWLYNPGFPVFPDKIHVPYFDHPFFNRTLEGLANGEDFNSLVFTKKEKDDFLDHLYTNTIARNTPEERKKFAYRAPGFAWSTVYLKNTALTIANYDAEPYTEEQNTIIRRFGNVFEQTYTRFLDLRKAEAQAREGEIQLALERVRARSLAMHHTSELQEVVNIVAEQLHHINIEINGGVIITINDEVDKDIALWASAGAVDYVQKIVVPFLNKPVFTRLRDAIKKRNNFLVEEYTKKEKNEFFKHLFKYAPWNQASEKSKVELLSREGGYTRSVAVLKFTSIAIINDNGKKFSAEDNEILKRFGNVFEQAYTRFLDLQKAEAQAREAQIEAALERVRSRSMGMQKSIELGEVVHLLDNEIGGLGIMIDNTSIVTDFSEFEKGINTWIAAGGRSYLEKFHVPYADNMIYRKFIDAITNAVGYYTEKYSKVEKDRYFEWLYKYSDFKTIPNEQRNFSLGAPGWTRASVVSKNSALAFQRFNLEEYTEEENGIFKRFGKVFEQTYTRFLDLQKAEVQAREAEIQLALERVRARTMAMQKQNDLLDVLNLLIEQLIKLGVQLEVANFSDGLPDGDWNLWISGPKDEGTIFTDYVHLPRIDHPYFQRAEKGLEIYKAGGTDLGKEVFTKKEKDSFQDYLLSQTIYKDVVPDKGKQYIYNKPGYTWSAIILKDTWVSIGRYSTTPFTDEEDALLRRFANAFGLAYTRFLDLQKAEAQARESQIQLALERVRARTMAMQRSDELSEAVFILFQQFRELGEKPDQATIGVINEKEKVIEYWVTMYGKQMDGVFKFSIKEPHVTKKIFNAWKENKKSLVIDLSGKELYEFADYREKMGGAKYNSDEKRRIINVAFFSKGLLNVQSNESRSEESIRLLERFAFVFEQTYTRFLDLQKAEAQARESQVQLALERVRARTMAMQKQNDLPGVLDLLVEQLVKLGVHLEVANFSNNIPGGDWDLWIEVIAIDGSIYNNYIHFPRINHPYFNHVEKNIEIYKTEGTDLFKDVFSKEEKDSWQDYIYSQTIYKEIVPEEHKQILYDKPGYIWSMVILKDTWVSICRFNTAPFSDEEDELLRRFANAFGLAYTRFLDLKKAEAQAREAQIEAALERVRSRTMGMQRSEELKEAAQLLFQQVQTFGIDQWACGYNIWEPDGKTCIAWMSRQGILQPPFKTNISTDKCFRRFYNAKQRGEIFYVEEIGGDEIKEHYKRLLSLPEFNSAPKEFFDEFIAPEFQIFHIVHFAQGYLMFITYEPVPHLWDIFQRFGKVFEQTYTRFLDLQNAEAQAREAQIEAALERVRAKAMAMQNSNDLSIAASMVFTELRKLGIDPIRCGVGLLNKESRKAQLYSAISSNDGDSLSLVGWVMLTGHPVLENIYDTWLKKEDYYPELTGPQLKSYYENLLAGLSLPTVPNSETGEKQYGHFFSFSVGCLYAWSDRHYNDSEIKILKRFAAIIDLTFRRYLDLQKAEANAKEAKIEASLERVRGKAMAMHSSQDLSDTIGIFYQELKSFSLSPRRCGVGLLNKEERIGELFTWNTTDQGESLELVGRLKMEGHPVLNKVYESWVTQTEYHPVLRGNEIKEYYKVIKPQMAFPDYKQDDVQFGYFFFFPEGGVYGWTEKKMQQDELQIYRRFTSVLSLTYKRYRDLQNAEANAKEAVKQSALDRIRADIASMRTISDLDRITPLIWNELTILGVPFIRCGVFIMDDDQQQIHTFLSTPEGKGIAAFHLPYNTPGNIAHVITHWQKKEIYTDHWDEEAFKEFADNLVQQGAMKSSEQYLRTMPAGGFNLHFVPFQQGMLYVGNLAPLGEEEINLLQSIADAFSTAYARYEDFNKLEAAKRQVDNTLTELKQAQQQLVQSEKMASLGELTAGIAHEIQNPLNFVNNFSDVNSELIGEMQIELQNGNVEEAIAIANDIKENEEKINHHGKRADAIVKGMLQHSRKSSGQKELTDINVLADEYLRLSYHGMRAKDKSFNAKYETDFDNKIGKINIIPQDIGRVLLNLFNNAFYAVNEQKSINSISYNPTVFVRTQKCDDKVQIIVRDNGKGIPQKLLDKIFQPFFTTKPTGSGTGLGLSLSYDTIKAHGGEIKVESKEDEGSKFIIWLPMI